MRFFQFAFAGVAAGLIVAAASSPQQAVARTASFNRSFQTPQGTVTQSGTKSFNPSTGVAAESVTTTGPKGATRIWSYSRTPDGEGGVTITRSLKGFNGQTHTSTRKFGP